MSHEITVREDGFAEAAFALDPAWHGLGTVLDRTMTSEEALIAAGLDWTVDQRPVGIGSPQEIETPEGPVEVVRYQAIPDVLANVRSDNHAFLGLVSDRYQVVNNADGFAFLDQLVEEHEMRYEAAFSLSGGKKVCLLSRMPKIDEAAPGDQLLRYVLLTLYHDGTGAIRFGPTSVRVVCANTYAIALREGNVKELSIRHTGDVETKLQRARAILGLASEQFEQFAGVSQTLAKRRLTTDEWEKFLDICCPPLDPVDPDWTERRARAIAKTREGIRDAYHNERQTLDGIGGTAWAAYNAVSEYVEHLPRRGATRERKAEARFNVQFFGPGRDQKQRAIETACRIAGLAV